MLTSKGDKQASTNLIKKKKFRQGFIPYAQHYQWWIRQRRYWMCVHCLYWSNQWNRMSSGLWRDSRTIQPYHPPTPCRWMAATLRQQLDYMESFLFNECFGNAICSNCPLQRWAEWAKCCGTEHTALSEVTDDFDSIVPLETGTSSHDSRVSDIEWHVYFLKHWHLSLPHLGWSSINPRDPSLTWKLAIY